VSHLAPTALKTTASPAVCCLTHKLAAANSSHNPYPHHTPLISDTLGLRAAPFKSHSKPTASGFFKPLNPKRPHSASIKPTEEMGAPDTALRLPGTDLSGKACLAKQASNYKNDSSQISKLLLHGSDLGSDERMMNKTINCEY
jgi:hypothetical protein